jgi:Fe2+ or Zn2+ uptake regulation protein
MQQNANHSLTILCDACGTREARDVDELHDVSHLTCRGCGNQIDLTQEPWKGEIQRLWNAAHDRGPARRRLP